MAVQIRWLWPGRACRLALLAAMTAAGMLLVPGLGLAADKHAVLILDANTGRVLHEAAAREPRHPASLAKMMTIYIALELVEQGKLSLQTKIRMSANAVLAAPSKLDLDEGEEIALIDAIKVLITKSANDVAVAVAEHIAGSEAKFARLMTRRAGQLGMAATVFKNASGLPDEEQVTTAHDMVTLALRLQDDFPQHYALFGTRTFTYKDETFRNHNKLLFNYEGADGLKTGYTRASGFNLVASVRRGRKHIIGAVFGGATAASRDSAMRTFLNMGLVKASSVKTRKPALVARNARAPQPTVAFVPTPHRVMRPAATPLAEPPPPPPPMMAAAAPPQAEPAQQPVRIARVRPVMLSEQPGGMAAVPTAQHPAAAFQPQEPPPPPQWAPASTGAMPARLAAAAPPERPALLASPQIVRGAAPSTLDQQAANLTRGDPPVAPPPLTTQALAPREPVSRLKGPAAAAAAPAGGFQVQIGAFQSIAEAERQLAAVRQRAGNALARHPDVTQPVRQGAKTLYRARYAGFDAQSATSICGELKRLKIDCLVMKAD
ncbi:MAG: D-alanyl-D-alanine carboxypeptidase [Hyphomicrobiaceae bacterium]|nr:MAG: D-alanyl-D-alanine carboxypeptidase [Hyphomicrobiaceae bacterium]